MQWLGDPETFSMLRAPAFFPFFLSSPPLAALAALAARPAPCDAPRDAPRPCDPVDTNTLGDKKVNDDLRRGGERGAGEEEGENTPGHSEQVRGSRE